MSWKEKTQIYQVFDFSVGHVFNEMIPSVFDVTQPEVLYELHKESVASFKDLYRIINTDIITVLAFPPDHQLRGKMVIVLDKNGAIRTASKINNFSKIVKQPLFGTVVVLPVEMWNNIPY